MELDIIGLLGACSYALDCVEAELTHVTTKHGKRVAYMSVCTAQKMGITGDALQDLAACSLDRPFFFYTVERMQQYTAQLPQLKGWVPMTQDDIKWLVSSDLHRSFPSGHTICCFEAATVLMIKNKWAGIPATIIAFLVAYSRLYLYVHYPTDVIFSMFAGILLGLLGCAIVSIVYHFLPQKRGKYQRI